MGKRSRGKRERREQSGLPPINRVPENLAGRSYYPAEIKEIRVAEFHEESDGKGSPTQVHLMLSVSGSPHPFVIRFKGPHTLGQIIAMLNRHRSSVWPWAPSVLDMG